MNPLMKLTAATTRFIEVPELVAHLAYRFLDYKSISCLMRTSRQLYAFCTPALFYGLCWLQLRQAKSFGLQKVDKSFAKNVNRVRQLNLHLCQLRVRLPGPVTDTTTASRHYRHMGGGGARAGGAGAGCDISVAAMMACSTGSSDLCRTPHSSDDAPDMIFRS